MRFTNHDIVFREFPDEITLAIHISGCPNRCPGCHSAYLQQDIGEELTEERLLNLVAPYRDEVTCVGFLGGDAHPDEVFRLARALKQHFGTQLHTGWYSGRDQLPQPSALQWLDYVKVGPYVKELGPLDAPATNQRIYRITQAKLQDITHLMRKG